MTDWMVGIQFSPPRGRPSGPRPRLLPGLAVGSTSSISQAQFWNQPHKRLFRDRFGDGTVGGVLSVDISDWNREGTFVKKPAKRCTRQEIKTEVWEQLKAGLNKPGSTLLRDDFLARWHLDGEVEFVDGRPPVNHSPLLVHPPTSWDLRPTAALRVENLVLASDYVRTHTILACMEGANEAARRAVNAIRRRRVRRPEPVPGLAFARSPMFDRRQGPRRDRLCASRPGPCPGSSPSCGPRGLLPTSTRSAGSRGRSRLSPCPPALRRTPCSRDHNSRPVIGRAWPGMSVFANAGARLSVVLADKADFPRDKPCGGGAERARRAPLAVRSGAGGRAHGVRDRGQPRPARRRAASSRAAHVSDGSGSPRCLPGGSRRSQGRRAAPAGAGARCLAAAGSCRRKGGSRDVRGARAGRSGCQRLHRAARGRRYPTPARIALEARAPLAGPSLAMGAHHGREPRLRTGRVRVDLPQGRSLQRRRRWLGARGTHASGAPPRAVHLL